MGREHRIIAGLQATAVPVPPALGLCDDPAVNGAPFYVMGFVDGHVVRDRADRRGARSSADARANASRSIVDTMAAIHAVDLDAAGLADLARHEGYIARQLKRWYGQWNQQKTRELPLVDEVHDALAAHGPRAGPGDDRPRRLPPRQHDRRPPTGDVAAVLDWEICTLGDPLADVGLLQVYWTGPDDAPSAWGGAVDDGAGLLGPRPASPSATPRCPAATCRQPRLLRRVRLLEAGLHPRGRVRPLPRRRARRPRPGRAGAVQAPRSTPPRRRPPSTLERVL